jgi:nitrate/nitrite transport system permease protein
MTSIQEEKAASQDADPQADIAAYRASAPAPQKRDTAPLRAAGLFIAMAVAGIALWAAATQGGAETSMAPTPAATWQRFTEVFSDPFYVNGMNSVGIFWHLTASLQRVLIGFGLAAAVAIPLGFALGSSKVLRWAVDPFVQILRPVSPLAWLPLGLALLQDAERTALFVIFISALWPVLLNTIEGVRNINPLYINLARTLEAKPLTRIRKIMLPAALPSIISGLRLSLSTSWLVIIAAEMLVGGRGMGYFVWNEWNKLNIPSIIVAIVIIGLVGLVLDRAIVALQKLVPNA